MRDLLRCPAQFLSKILAQGQEENALGDLFFLHAAEVTVPVRASHLNPIGGPVTSACKSIILHKRFQQHRSDAVNRLPIRGDPFYDPAENHGGQVWASNPG